MATGGCVKPAQIIRYTKFGTLAVLFHFSSTLFPSSTKTLSPSADIVKANIDNMSAIISSNQKILAWFHGKT